MHHLGITSSNDIGQPSLDPPVDQFADRVDAMIDEMWDDPTLLEMVINSCGDMDAALELLSYDDKRVHDFFHRCAKEYVEAQDQLWGEP